MSLARRSALELAPFTLTPDPFELNEAAGSRLDIRIEPDFVTEAWRSDVAAILMAWYPGVQAGPALTRVLTGDAAPSGKLTATMPRAVGQVPIYYNHLKTGRPVPGPDDEKKDEGYKFLSRYVDEDGSPLYAFGHGHLGLT